MTAPSHVTSAIRTGYSGGDGFRADVQGLRAIAVLLVLLYHAGVPGFSAGFVGVDVFFVISGFLITTHLVQTKRKTGRIRFISFYARRIQRLLPAAIIVILATAVAGLAFVPRPLMSDELIAGAASLLYIPNIYFAYRGSDYLAGGTDSLFQQYWSLGVEEQFYLVWPLLVAGLLWVGRKRFSVAIFGIALLVAGSFLLCIFAMRVSQPWAFYSLPTRAWELGVGGLVAAVVMSSAAWSPMLSALASWIGAASLVLSVVIIDADSGFPAPWAALPVLGTALVIFGGSRSRSSPVGSLLGWRIAQRLGDISYSVYLVHWPLLIIPFLVVGDDLPLLVRLALAALAIPIGWLVYKAVETPLRTSAALRRAPKRLVAFAAASALVLASGALVTRVVVENLPYGSTRQVSALTSPQEFPAGTGFVPDDSAPSLMLARDDNPIVYSSECHQEETQTGFEVCVFGDPNAQRTMVLFGDSHAANWFPALDVIARDGGFRLESYSKSSCSSATVERKFQGRAYWECEEWRARVISHLNEISPDLVILSNFTPSSREKTSFIDQDRATVDVWTAGVEQTIRELTSAKDVVVIEDTPRQSEDPVICLARHLEDADACATPVDSALRDDVAGAERVIVEATGARYISLNDYLCNANDCPVVVGDMLVYRDPHHLTATFSRFMVPVLRSRLFPSDADS